MAHKLACCRLLLLHSEEAPCGNRSPPAGSGLQARELSLFLPSFLPQCMTPQRELAPMGTLNRVFRCEKVCVSVCVQVGEDETLLHEGHQLLDEHTATLGCWGWAKTCTAVYGPSCDPARELRPFPTLFPHATHRLVDEERKKISSLSLSLSLALSLAAVSFHWHLCVELPFCEVIRSSGCSRVDFCSTRTKQAEAVRSSAESKFALFLSWSFGASKAHLAVKLRCCIERIRACHCRGLGLLVSVLEFRVGFAVS